MHYDRRQRELFVCDAGRRRIAVVNDAGVPTFSFGSDETLEAPRGVAVDREGRIYVADAVREGVRVFDYDGEPLDDVDLGAVPAGERPMRFSALALDDDGTLYLADRANGRIVIVAPDRASAEVIAPPPSRADLLRSPVDLERMPSGDLAVVDSSGLAVQIWSRDGRFLRGWGEHDVGRHNFSLPSGIAVDAQGRIFVSDTLRQDVKVFRADGTFLTNFGGLGSGPGAVRYPVDVASDGAGRIFVAEKNNLRVQIFEVVEPGDDASGEVRESPQVGG